MASSKLEALVSRARLVEVRDFWFEHLTGPDDLILFKQEHGKRWFFGGQELDRACVERFGPALEAIRDSGVRSGADMLAVARPQDPSEWLGLVLLLDQMPRNCYRGDAAAVAFTIFDPIARGVALAAMQRGVPDEEPATRWRFAYRQWFYLPLMHSEDVATHEVAEQAYERMRRDVSALIDGGDAAPDGSAVGGEDRARAAAVVRANADDARKLVDMQILFEKKHFDIIKRFGRYPHRNKVLGRTSTPEEVEYLENGGETFSQPPADAGDKK
ncbi:hypothetical protein HIM_05685 [Hirsutella minnesotensis 3608]|uniref:Uncharacterized protein n=1 Tax=Hirsutella minnesotensis 3608 TaxID=1043627 RepID=A0A0F8A598_9HYPO|nr:hypothetical protein HIM_05685 [Hirsutella minnesotensis 3608]